MTPIETSDRRVAAESRLRADARRNREAIVRAARELFAKKDMDAEMDEVARRAGVGVGAVRANRAVSQASEREAWEAFRQFVEWAAEMQAGDRALSEAMASRSQRTHAAAVDSGLVTQLELLLDLAKRAGALAMAAAEKPRWRWDRVLAIWLDGVRAPAVSQLPPLPD
jgi:AcrR family transcriptional regulator